MPQLLINDFSKGWCPSDDAINGRKDALLQMTGLDLEQNGAVRMTGGTEIVSSALAASSHTLYSTYLGGQKFRYVAMQNGHVARNGTVIVTNNGFNRTAFGKGFDRVLIFSGNARVQDDGFTAVPEEVALPTPPNALLPVSTVTTTTFDGDYEWKFIYVARAGGAIRRSKASPLSASLTLTPTQGVSLTIENPIISLGYTQVDEIWVYRRGGALDKFYRTQIILSTYFGGSNYFTMADNLPDDYVLDEGEELNEFVTTVNYIDTPDEILEIVGPINGRHFYFTASSCLITERNSPSTYDIRNIVNIAASVGEVFLFAKQVGESSIIIGTTENIYSLSGTFSDLPDGIIDVFFRAIGVAEKPISISCCTYKGALIYLSQAGWQVLDANSGQLTSLVAPNIDRLYNGETCYEYFPVLMYGGGNFRFHCAVVNDRFYCLVLTTLGYRLECYDFSRRYWRTFVFAFQLENIFGESDGTLIGFASNDRKLRELDRKDIKTIDGSNQQIVFLTPFYDHGLTRNKKDTQVVKFRGLTGGANATISLYIDNNSTSYVKQWTVNSSVITEFILDAPDIVAKNYQLKITGTLPDFIFEDLTITYEPRPESVKYLRIPYSNLGTAARKKIPAYPLVIDTNGRDVNVFVNSESGGALASQVVNTANKQTAIVYPSDFTPCRDFEVIIESATNEFEFYDLLQSKFTEVYPEQLTRYQSPTYNLGTFGEKMVVVWPFCIDTLATDVTMLVYVGPALHSSVIFNHGYKKSINFTFSPLLQGVDIRFELIGGLFELWEVGKPEVVRAYPVGRKYDYISGLELAPYTKIRRIEMRVVRGDSNPIPCEIYSQGVLLYQGQFVTSSAEDVYTLDIPKTVANRVFDIKIGPVAAEFKRIGTRVQFAASNKETDLRWETV